MALRSPRFAGNARLEKAAENNPRAGARLANRSASSSRAFTDLGYWLDISTSSHRRRHLRQRNLRPSEGVPTLQRALPRWHRRPVDHGRVRQGASWGRPRPAAAAEDVGVQTPRSHSPAFACARHHRAALPAREQRPDGPRPVRHPAGDRHRPIDVPDRSRANQIFENVNVGECNLKFEPGVDGSAQQGSVGVGADEIVVFFARKISDQTGAELNGCAEQDARNRAITVVSSTASPWSMGHEIVHVLRGAYTVHSTDNGNLMFTPTANIVANPPSLDPTQLTTIRASRYCRAI